MTRRLRTAAGFGSIALFVGCNTSPVISPGEHSIRPDDFAAGTQLTQINAAVTLTTAGSDNAPIDHFVVTASDDGQSRAPSGVRVFGHDDIPFFNNDFRMRMDFAQPASTVRLFFAGGTFSATEIGRLQVYDQFDNLLNEYVTAPRGPGEVEEMAISRASADIAWAVAFIAENEGSFGRLDDLTFTIGL
jgi:hypothetical protein